MGIGTVSDGCSETYNRGQNVAQCFVDGAHIAAWMVRSGHTCDWLKFSSGAYSGRFQKQERHQSTSVYEDIFPLIA
jgi:endonuclease YncB( thermonuclease family)